MTKIGPDRVALVTGASRGIGRDVALLLAERGYAVAVNYRASREQAEEVTRAIESTGGHGLPLQADVGDPTQAAQLVRTAEERLGPLDVLVNNAGITRDRLLVQMSADDWDATWQTNLAGARAAGRAALASMAPRGRGRIVNVSSVVGATGNAGQANYAAAKSAVHGLTRQMAIDGAPYGVAVNCVVPGLIVTDATAHLTGGQREAWLRRIPAGRSAPPRDVAELIVYLAAWASDYITGQCIAIDGGLLAAAGQGWTS